MTEWITQFILFFKDLSYAGLVIALSFEFVPAELVLPMAGYWVYLGDMKLWLAILAGTVGGTFGPLTLYALGRYGGRPMVEKFGKYFLIRPHHLDASDKFFEKYGSGVAFYGRFVPGIRTVISIPCGMAKMNVFKFSIFTFLAMLPITSLYIYLGFKLGSQWEHVDEIVKPYIVPAAVVFLGAFGLYVLLKRWKRRTALNKS
ncbi:DedA family protein [Paenibacillus sp. FSL H8-0317]|uniref:Membrane protein DedA with SNARE-associated domain n=1 Tax=Paenibacillus xylanexedens TaxID=528191 RepID=A0ABS4RSJ8_PAEXY|nr:DedA family protein [Paenibacillus xylanexedens]MBP2245855.1 membrane protein DedA with SNARE-associated domain [Paenibacillus xylanexedens]